MTGSEVGAKYFFTTLETPKKTAKASERSTRAITMNIASNQSLVLLSGQLNKTFMLKKEKTPIKTKQSIANRRPHEDR